VEQDENLQFDVDKLIAECAECEKVDCTIKLIAWFWINVFFFALFVIGNILFLQNAFVDIQRGAGWSLFLVMFGNPIVIVFSCFITAVVMVNCHKLGFYKKIQHFCGFAVIVVLIASILVFAIYMTEVQQILLTILTPIFGVLVAGRIVLQIFAYKTIGRQLNSIKKDAQNKV